jgi:AcrR family transcriptional regulator
LSDCARPARAEARILEATRAELAAHGFEGLTVEGVAAAAGVGRATIYRHWANRAELVIAAFRSAAQPRELPDTGTLRGDLIAQVTNLASALSSSPMGAMLPALLEAARRDRELAPLQRALIDERRAETASLLDRAVDRGELPADVDRDLLLDLVVGPVFYRHLVRHRRTTRDEVVRIVDQILATQLGAPSPS